MEVSSDTTSSGVTPGAAPPTTRASAPSPSWSKHCMTGITLCFKVEQVSSFSVSDKIRRTIVTNTLLLFCEFFSIYFIKHHFSFIQSLHFNALQIYIYLFHPCLLLHFYKQLLIFTSVIFLSIFGLELLTLEQIEFSTILFSRFR